MLEPFVSKNVSINLFSYSKNQFEIILTQPYYFRSNKYKNPKTVYAGLPEIACCHSLFRYSYKSNQN